jgi:hypothetical protein
MRSTGTLHEAHEDFVSSRRTSPAVCPLVADSWSRSAAGGASTGGGVLPAVRLQVAELGDYRAGHRLAPLLPVFRELLGEDAPDDDYIFAIAAVDGTLLWVEGDRDVLAAAERMNFVEGAVWTETEAGTNAPRTALAVGRPVRILGPEHYNTAVQPWSCSAAPIRDPDGRLLGMRVFQDVIFGPVLAVTTFKDEAEALRIANDTLYGLGAGGWTRDGGRAYRMGRGIKAGRVWTNCYHLYPAGAAFGGYKVWGIGRETHKMMLDHYSQTKNLLVRYSQKPLGFF